MKKRGFTLIELLAVIVILAIIALIVIPMIARNISNARKKAFETKLYALVDAAESYYNDSYLDPDPLNEMEFEEGIDGVPTYTINMADSTQVSLLDMKGDTFKKGLVTITEDGRISAVVKDSNYCGQKLDSNKEVEILDRDNDIMCVLLDTNLAGSGINEKNILSALQNLSDSHSSLTNKIAELNEQIEELEGNRLGTIGALNKLYPVGSIYISTNLDTPAKVASALGGGTWVAYADGKVLRSSTGTSGQTGGSSTHSLSKSEMPAHIHTLNSHSHSFTPVGTNSYTTKDVATGNQSANHTHSVPAMNGTLTQGSTAATGGNHQHYFTTVLRHVSSGHEYAGGFNSCGTWGEFALKVIGWYGTNNTGGHAHTVTINAATTGGSSANHTHTATAANLKTSIGTITFTGTKNIATEGSSAANTGNAGSGTAFSVLDPDIKVYMYKRTA